jgi:thiol-disulfide isomerase/thioredoxin
MAKEESHLLEFYGRECPHCMTMQPFVEKLEKETGLKVAKFEVWHNAENAALMEKYDPGGSRCGGVPFFFNTKTGKWICGAVDYKTLKEWALGGQEKNKK